MAAAAAIGTPSFLFESWNIDTETALNETMPYLQLLQASAFTICPAGDMWDSYRAWEALHSGSIPIVIEPHATQKGCNR